MPGNNGGSKPARKMRVPQKKKHPPTMKQEKGKFKRKFAPSSWTQNIIEKNSEPQIQRLEKRKNRGLRGRWYAHHQGEQAGKTSADSGKRAASSWK